MTDLSEILSQTRVETTYRIRFLAVCPAHPDAGATDEYQAELSTVTEDGSPIPVEALISFVERYLRTPTWQERIAYELADRFGATVRLTGSHSGVAVSCTASRG